MADHDTPAHDLAEIQGAIRAGAMPHISRVARDGAAQLELDVDDIIECILGLSANDFYKSMDADNPMWKGCRQDVYRPTCGEMPIYLKLQYWPVTTRRLYVASFKER